MRWKAEASQKIMVLVVLQLYLTFLSRSSSPLVSSNYKFGYVKTNSDKRNSLTKQSATSSEVALIFLKTNPAHKKFVCGIVAFATFTF